MDTKQVRRVAVRLGQCVSITADPNAERCERWAAVIGFDGMAVARTPQAAVRKALADFSQRNGTQRAIRRRRVIA